MAEPPDDVVEEPGAEGSADASSRRARRARKRPRNPALEWGVLIVIALLVAVVIRAFIFQTFWIPSGSMIPTLEIDDRVLVNKLSYRVHDPNRGDIVVFKAPPGTETADIKDLIKRIVGMPGETIEGRDGHVYLDGKLLKEPYLDDRVETSTFGPTKIPDDEYYLLGDNRGSSADSRSFGPVGSDQLVGRAFLRLWPPSRIGFL